jgi:hypothetical protein
MLVIEPKTELFPAVFTAPPLPTVTVYVVPELTESAGSAEELAPDDSPDTEQR